MTLNLFAHSHA